MGRRRKVQKYEETRFDNPRQRGMMAGLVVAGLLVATLIVLLVMYFFFPDPLLDLETQTFGGFQKQDDRRPRAIEVWYVYPDDTVRQITAYYMDYKNVGISQVYNGAGPYVNLPEDILDVKYFGALSAIGHIQPGTDNDTERYFQFVAFEPDLAADSYGLNVLTRNSPYLATDQRDASVRMLGLAARLNMSQSYYQYLVGVAIPPGAAIESATYAVPPAVSATISPPPAEKMLHPYRRVVISGWVVYLYDTSQLSDVQTIRVRYRLPGDSTLLAGEPTVWDIYAQR